MYNHKKILVVLDTPALREIVDNLLSPYYKLIFQNNINKCLNILDHTHLDLVLIGERNSSGNSFELARRVKMESSAKIIFFLNNSSINIKESSFESGADDVLTQPFSPKELHLRIKRLFNEYENSINSVVIQRGLALYKATKCVKYNNCTVNLSPTEYILFEYLITTNKYHSRESLHQYISCRKNKEITDTSITVLIKRLRRKLHMATGMEVIKTRYGLGYYLAV